MKYLISVLLIVFPACFLKALTPIAGTTHVCVGSSTALTDATSGGAWSSSSPATATVGVSTGVVYGVASGVVTITYTVGASFVTSAVTVNPLPAVFSVSGGGSFCAGDSGVHVGLSGSQAGVNYMLYIGGSPTGPFTGTGSALDFGLQTVAGVYIVAGISAATGCSNNMAGSVSVTVNPIVVPAVSISAFPADTVCSGTSTTFTAIADSVGATPLYQWSVNGTVVGGDSSHYVFVPADGDVVSVQVVSSMACSVPDTLSYYDTVSVVTRVTPLVNIAPYPGLHLCAGDPVLLTAVAVYGGPAPVYTWVRNGSIATSGPTYTLIPANGDVIYCVMASNYRCLLTDSAFSSPVSIVVDSPVTPYVTIEATPGAIVGIGQYDTLHAIVTSGGPSPRYQWIVNTTTITGATNSTFVSDTFSAGAPDSVTCIVTGSGACEISSYSWIYIVVSGVGVPGVYTVDAPRIAPNPAHDRITITNTGNAAIGVFDLLGRVQEVPVPNSISGGLSLDVSALPQGIYLLELKDPDTGGQRVIRFVKE